MSDSKHYLTTDQAAEYLGVARQTLAKWRCTGEVKIPFARIGRKVVYPVNELDAFVAANMASSTSEIGTAGE